MSELLPCPFCGGNDLRVELHGIACRYCGVWMGDGTNVKGTLKDAWNRRATDDKVMMMVEVKQVCTWRLDEWGNEPWVSDCGLQWALPDGPPKDNGMRFCPGCGKALAALGQGVGYDEA